MSRHAIFKFRLYVAGDASNSVQAQTNLALLCRAYLPQRHQIEVVDVFREPKRALADSVFMTPTLVKLGPAPQRRIVGTLSQTQTVLLALGLEALPP
ncbi:MAG: circadian clock KaiB family protein [Burkholderiaceae bacterium]|nr:circadian clock KaiB family protein [Burkholderiaceae bacterium]